MDPNIVIEGMENIIARDLENHKALLERTKTELDSFKLARAHEIKRKRHYSSLIGEGKYSDDSLQTAMSDITVNIQHMTDKVTVFEQKLDHHKLIVDTLTLQLKEQMMGLAYLNDYRREHGPAN